MVAYSLIAFFVTLPHLRWNNKPPVLLDIPNQQFTLLGHTFYATDTPLVALLALTAFFTIMFSTAVFGRVWCGWACPQTVYLEFLFRPIDRFFGFNSSKRAASTPKRVLHFIVYIAASMFLAHTFLSYFVPTDELARWITSSPFKHPMAFFVMSAFTACMLFNFFYFREQLCMVACPYGRFQSVLLDRRSLIVTYDIGRGEPRHKGRVDSSQAAGDCIDCGHCTTVCPTGIDIRNGLQMECIHCTQCIDACNAIMDRIDKPQGLIRFASQESLAGNPKSWLRVRTIVYPICLMAALTLFFVLLSTKFAFDARVLRLPGAQYSIVNSEQVQNNFRIRLVNRSQTTQEYRLKANDSAIQVAWSNAEAPKLEPGESLLLPIEVQFPVPLTIGKGTVDHRFSILDSEGHERQLHVKLLGPK